MSVKNAPAAPDYKGAAGAQAQGSKEAVQQQTQANRPNIDTAYGSQQWQQGPDGQWHMQTGFNGPLSEANTNLQNQAMQAMATPLDFGGPMGNGEDARNQAITASYNQASSRLNPQWDHREEAMRAQLANQGLDANSEAAHAAQRDFGQSRNDAYGSAMNSAVMQGQSAGDSVFRNNLMSRQQAISEALRKREQPLQEMGQMQGLLNMPGFNNAGAAQPRQDLPAAIAQGNMDQQRWQSENEANGDFWGGILKGGEGIASLFALSDEKAKRDVVRLPVEALPGVPFATWRYLPEYDASGRTHLGVIAQDVARVAPEYVRTRPDGLLEVDYSFLQR